MYQVPFLIEAGALLISGKRALSETECLTAFDAVRGSIRNVARTAYSRGRRTLYTLTATDFRTSLCRLGAGISNLTPGADRTVVNGLIGVTLRKLRYPKQESDVNQPAIQTSIGRLLCKDCPQALHLRLYAWLKRGRVSRDASVRRKRPVDIGKTAFVSCRQGQISCFELATASKRSSASPS
uniref:DUF1488 family protein n=1 Tax=Pararhizobium sp. IMCC3301 TaxID=3067904 RepID=UPI002741BC2C|nr:DUF1488 family protein [Pararhizobium sp. IMCC3301]